MNRRDWFFTFLGFMSAGLGILAWVIQDESTHNRVMNWVKKITTIYKIPYTGGFPIKNHEKNNPPKDGKKIWPPNHPGGGPIQEYDWSFTELIIKQGLSKVEAFEVFIQKFPHRDHSNVGQGQNDKDNFISAMKYRENRLKNR